jgi:hypothetical protein
MVRIELRVDQGVSVENTAGNPISLMRLEDFFSLLAESLGMEGGTLEVRVKEPRAMHKGKEVVLKHHRGEDLVLCVAPVSWSTLGAYCMVAMREISPIRSTSEWNALLKLYCRELSAIRAQSASERCASDALSMRRNKL